MDGLLIGFQIVGPPGSDPKNLRLAHTVHRAISHDERPQIN
ncbi:hypothetical protein Franean1_3171 [Parafrankia sp. EAN1pec]|nr:hypothetical protein Franean1_3171 [Frankia sp. EAN1pec]